MKEMIMENGSPFGAHRRGRMLNGMAGNTRNTSFIKRKYTGPFLRMRGIK